MLSKRVRGMILPKDVVKCIREWLGYEAGGIGSLVCPFTNLRPVGCSICQKVFPSSLKSDDYYGGCTCPCHTLSLAYVRETAQGLVRNYTDAGNLKNIIKITRRLAKEYKIKLGVKR